MATGKVHFWCLQSHSENTKDESGRFLELDRKNTQGNKQDKNMGNSNKITIFSELSNTETGCPKEALNLLSQRYLKLIQTWP